MPGPEYGIDLTVEVFEAGQATGRTASVQRWHGRNRIGRNMVIETREVADTKLKPHITRNPSNMLDRVVIASQPGRGG